jgi:SAM-dependent methyltransferase
VTDPQADGPPAGFGGGDWARWREQVDLSDYDERWKRMADSGQNPHGEADLVCAYEPHSVLDAGCGTGRVAIELARRGIAVVGTDLDADMIAAARAKAPTLTWIESDLGDVVLDPPVEVVVMAGNVIPFVSPSRRPAAVAACARALVDGGRVIAGFQLRDGWPTLADYDGWCADAGLVLEDRWSTWDRHPFTNGDAYAVSVHRR